MNKLFGAPEQHDFDNAQQPLREAKGFFGRHWNGDYSLARSYWLHLTGGMLLLGCVIYLGVFWAEANLDLRWRAVFLLATLPTAILIWAWLAKGTFASANKHEERGGKKIWANIARFLIVIGVFRIAVDLVSEHELYSQLWDVATASEAELQPHLQISADLSTIIVTGAIRDGSAREIENLLTQQPLIKWIEFESDGGIIKESRMIADIIKKRRLNTYVPHYCASTCTLAFLAGEERVAGQEAKIGFNSFRGMAQRESAKLKNGFFSEEDEHQLYADAGLNPDFVRQISVTPVDDSMFPTHQEMLSIGVLTR